MSATTQTKLPPVIKTVRVPCTQEKAFGLFTAQLRDWWPLSKYSIAAQTDQPAEFCAMEPRVGGRIYERLQSGAEHIWGTILAWDPPNRIEFTWYPGRPVETAQTVIVEFKPVQTETELTLTHTGWEKLGDAAAETRGSYDGGWEMVLGCYRAEVK